MKTIFLLFVCLKQYFAQQEAQQRQEDNLDPNLIKAVCAIMTFGLLYFAYNFYVCHAKKQELYDEVNEDDEYGTGMMTRCQTTES